MTEPSRPVTMEPLEARSLFAAAPIVLPDAGLTPDIIRNVYGFPNVTFTNHKGRTVAANGLGQTIAIVNPYFPPTIANDLRQFDKAFGLPNRLPNGNFVLTVLQPQGRPPINASFAQEASVDVEWAHAIAPAAKILLVEARSSSPDDLVRAVNFARNRRGVTVVSMSFGYDAPPPNAADFNAVFSTPPRHIGVTRGDGVSFVMAGGDDGVLTAWPDTTVPVVSVGGTLLTLDPSGNYVSESIQTGDSNSSLVGYASAGNAGYDIFCGLEFQGQVGFQAVQGTSVACPQWAALIAIADQGRALAGKHALDQVSQTLPALSTLLPDSDFHMVIDGGTATGRGSPFADRVIPDLVSI